MKNIISSVKRFKQENEEAYWTVILMIWGIAIFLALGIAGAEDMKHLQ